MNDHDRGAELNRRMLPSLRYRLSTFLILVTICCCLVARRVPTIQRQIEITKELQSLGGDVGYDYELDSNSQFISNAKSLWPEWVLSRAGVNALHSIVSVELAGSKPSEALLRKIANLDRLKVLLLAGTDIDSTTIQHLRGLHQLRYVDLTCNSLDDSGLTAFSQMRQLEFLCLQHQSRQFTDEGLRHLSKLASLKELQFYDSDITDAGLVHLESLKELRVLWLSNSQVTDAGVAALQKHLPNCKISH